MSAYVTGISQQALANVCPPPADYYNEGDLLTMFHNGVASDNLVTDSATGRIPVAQLAEHVENLQGSGVLKRRPEVKVGMGFETNMDDLVKYDAELFNRLNDEYCYYEQRYRYALKQFLGKATSRVQSDNAAAQVMLQNTKLLNQRLNGVLETMNYLAASRVDMVNQNKDAINTYNKSINEKLSALKSTYDMLNKTNAIVRTQKEAVRYTEEKNNFTTNQISVWAALNVLALATIFYVYRA
jgi:hypothetical protein